MKKILYVLVLAFVLTACGKAENKLEQEDSVVDSESKDDRETEEASQSTEQEITEQKTTRNKDDSSQKDSQNTENSSQKPSNNAFQNSNQKVESSTNNSNQNSSQKPAQNSGQNSNNMSQNENQSTNQSTTQKPVKKPVKRVSEEVKSAEVAYKYGVTKYDVTTNYYTLYSDDSKELIDSLSYTVYNSSNYNATDSQLKGESDSNASKYMNYYQEVLRLVNEIRVAAGVAPLTLDTTLCKAASMRALEMDYSNEMSHTRPSGKDCFSVLDFYGASFGACGENIAAGQTNAASVVKAWKNSPGHYENMVNPSYTKLGIGYSFTSVGDYGYYWCQLFTN